MNYTTMMKDSVSYIERFKDIELTADSIGNMYCYTGAYFSYLFGTFYEDDLQTFLKKSREGNTDIKYKKVLNRSEVAMEYKSLPSFYIDKCIFNENDDKSYYNPIGKICTEYEELLSQEKLSEDDGWIALWTHDETYTSQYVYGKQYSNMEQLPDPSNSIRIPSGKYMIFSKIGNPDNDSLEEQMKQLIRYAYGVWLSGNEKKRNRLGFAFETYQNGKAYFYLPVLEKDKQEEDKVYSIDSWTKYIDAHITENLTTTELADIFHYSPTHLRRVFRYYYKMSISDYIRKRRLELAASDIRGGMKCKDVAEKYGFCTYAGFTRAYQKEFNMTPLQYGKSMVEVVDLARYYEEFKDRLVVTYVNMKDIKMIGYPILTGKNMDADIPAQVCYWMNREFPCLENTRFCCNVERREEKIALWYHRPECRYIEYILGPVVEEFSDDMPKEMHKVTIKGGRYAVFETEKESDKEELPEILRMYTRCVFYGWVKEHRKQVDLSKITFERYMDNKVYFCVPLKD